MEKIVSLVAIIILGIIGYTCTVNGIDGLAQSGICALIAGIAGYNIKGRRMEK